MESRKYEDKQGNNRIAWELQAEGFEFCGKRGNDAATANSSTNSVPDFAEPDTGEDVLF